MFLLTGLALLSFAANAQPFNYDESKVPKFKLPNPLLMEDGTRVTTTEQWRKERRPEILSLFEKHVYGRSPSRPKAMTFVVVESKKGVLGGTANRKQVEVRFSGKADGPRMTILIYVPSKSKKPTPTFLTLNFRGNHTIN